ncbi:MAG: indole-3-glycerol-phosphate synthase [Methanocellales archaeon]|nr:indole-3-glycerol-phosphate synthase [Methanocellales archaeon]
MLIDDILSDTKKRVERIKTKSFRVQNRDVIGRMRAKLGAGKVPVIAEIKPSSPQRGRIRIIDAKEAVQIAKQLQEDVIAISVLTEPKFFDGNIENLRAVREAVDVPVLRKDFIIDSRQLQEVESDMILLITRILGDELNCLVNRAMFYGFEPIVEVHSKDEIKMALKTPARMIGINNRDLSTLKVDLSVTEELAPIIRDKSPQCMIISESGIENAEDVKRVINAGADAVLVGTAIMQDIGKAAELANALRG